MADLVARLVFILGITNLIGLFLVLFSCRCMMATFVNKLWKYDWYKSFMLIIVTIGGFLSFLF